MIHVSERCEWIKNSIAEYRYYLVRQSLKRSLKNDVPPVQKGGAWEGG